MINLDGIKRFINDNPNLWKEIESKPELFQYNHYMRFMDIVDIEYEHFLKNSSYGIYYANNVDINSALMLLCNNDISSVGKVYFVKLFPQNYPLRQYEEPHEYTSKINRIYLPITVGPKSQFCIEDLVFNPEPGNGISVDPDSLYTIYNNNSADDIYLVVDILKD